MPHTASERYAVVSCHVERLLDDRVWARFARLQRRRPGGFAIAALLRPPDEAAGEDAARWVQRAREAAVHGPLGHHTHWGGPATARPQPGSGEPVERVRREAAWLREVGLEPRLFCGGGWYLDAAVAGALAELGYADCTATAFRPGYLPPEARRASVDEPAWLRVDGGNRLLELPTTHSLGMAARAALAPGRGLPGVFHVYFHDTDLVHAGRRLALAAALRILGRRRRPTDLLRLAEEVSETAPELELSVALADESRCPP
ncbi:MAG: hypothetical protein ABR521_10575 [Gaiellaceae bacterium]